MSDCVTCRRSDAPGMWSILSRARIFTRAAHAVGVSKRMGKVWRNGRTRVSERNERPLVDWYAGRMKANNGHVGAKDPARHLNEDERIEIADLVQAGEGRARHRPQAGPQPVDHQPRTATQRALA